MDYSPKISNLDAMLWRREITLDEAINTMVDAYVTRIESAMANADPETRYYIWRAIMATCSPELRKKLCFHPYIAVTAHRARVVKEKKARNK